MDDKNRERQSNPLILESVYPDAAAIFSFQPEPITAVIADCLVVLDTNVLLVPYNTGKESLEHIRKIYSALAKQSRLIIPAQVAREFAQNRSEKIGTVFQQVSLKRNTSIKQQAYPLLESVAEYQEVIRLEQQIDSQLNEYRKAVALLLDAISSWYWNDPVSTLYRELFGEGVVHEPTIKADDFLKDLETRQEHKIPPGYKDASKSDRGVGDLLIWRAILELGQTRQKHVVLVSGDEKADWWHRSENQALFPRFELIDEYRRASGGRSFYIISFAELLELFGASAEVVKEVRQEEALVGLEISTSEDMRPTNRAMDAQRAVLRWLTQSVPPERIIRGLGTDFDFLVVDSSAPEAVAYKVRYIKVPVTLRDLRRIEDRVVRGLPPRVRRAYIVYVAANTRILEYLAHLMRRFTARYSLLGTIIGIIDATGAFADMLHVDPPATSGPSAPGEDRGRPLF
jgi:predicted nucleic acid-binding protein